MASATTTLGMEFEVFLSFRGPDTRDNFTSCLHHEMVEKGIRVFKDNEELQTGEKIGEELLQALEDIQIYIPIFSKDFASSSWCLREVAHMIDCTSKSDGKKQILPIFFNVEPDDVKLKTELYRDAMSKHSEKYGPDEVKRWEAALVEIPTRVGWKLEGRGYGELIGSIVREVQLKLKVKHRSLPDHLVKMDDQEAIEELLDVDSNDIRFIIIHGTGGIGKSTLAKVIFNRFLSRFNYSSFLEDVQDLSQRHGLLHVQKKLLSDTLGSTSTNEIHDTNDGINRIRKGLSNKKVMVVVDNVTEKKLLENLAGSYKWFGSGSKIIITVRDKRTIPYRTILDEENQMGPSRYMDYPVKEMPLDRAIQLFSKHAFRSNAPPQDWYNFSKQVVSSIGRLPLTMEVVGSLFANTDRSKWHETLKELKQVQCDEIRDTLMISFNTLDLQKKEIFLDIACFCIGEDKTNAYYMWEDCGYSPRNAVEDLLLMSLIKIDKYDKFMMHDELRDLGRYIVMEENFENAGKRRWAWIGENTLDVLKSNKEKPAIRALSMGISHDFTPEELACLPMLKFIGGKRLNFVGDFKNLCPELRWLSWHECAEYDLPMNFCQVNLVVLDVSYSFMSHHWEGWRLIEMAKKLKVLDLTWCRYLTKTLDFSKFGKLEKLILAWCENLSTIDSSIGKLQWLKTLSIEGCSSLKGLPEEIGYLECLSKIIMPIINNSFKFPKALGILKSLTEFHIEFGNGISQLHPSIGRLNNLKHLLLSKCKNLHELPESVGELESLVKLDLGYLGISMLPHSIGRLKNLRDLLLSNCKNLHKLPNSIGGLESLIKLDLGHSGISILPDSIGRLTNLRDLLLSKCKNLHVLPDSIGEMKSLVKLDLQLSGIFILSDSIGNLKRLKVIRVANAQLRTIPCALGQVETLEVLDASLCLHLMDQIPWEMWRLTCLRILDLYGSPISTVPTMISGFSSLQMLKISSHRLQPLPELPSSLKYLVVEAAHFPVLPDLSSLIHLDHLEVRRQQHMTFWMPNEVTSPWKDAQSINRLPPSLLTLKLHSIPQLPDIFNFQKLLVLSISGCLTPRLPNLSCLKRLQELWISDFPRLVEIPGLGELESLNFLHITTCDVIKQLPNLWKLKNLQRLEVKHCGKLRAIEGLKELNFLKIAKIKYCMSLERLPDMPTFTEVEINLTSLEVTEPTIQVGKRLRLSMD